MFACLPRMHAVYVTFSKAAQETLTSVADLSID